ncbi:MAG: cupin domain-containing protein [Spartobacteria bacterium]
MKKYSLLVIAIAAVASIVIAADEKEKPAASAAMEHKIFDSATIEWGGPPPGFPTGGKFAVLEGNPGEKGIYTVRLKAPAGYKIQAHTHPTAELITVISGNLHLGTGVKFDESKGDTMEPGSFTAMPAGMQHYAWFTEETEIQVHGEGPFEINYVNPADDPRNAKK